MSNALVSIPLCSLKRSKLNIRKTAPSEDLEHLAASIASTGLLENLVVRPNGKGGDSYEVIAGARRLAALKLLARRKKISRDHPISCLLLESSETSDIVEVSLAENLVRAPVHPADQFEAFAKLQKEGLPVEDIAARFGLAPAVVRQRLKLAAISPKLMTEYRNEAMTLELLMAFAISDDHEAQQQVWDQVAGSDPSPRTIRRLLTQSLVEGSDRRAVFVGARAYEAAGGVVLRDLFDEEGEGYFTDSQLLDRLVSERLEAEADALRNEGWAWVEVRPDNATLDLSRYGRIRMVEARLDDEEEARLTSLSERYDALVTQMEDEENAEISKDLDRVSAELEALQDKRGAWPEDEKKRAGAIVSLDYTGFPQVVRGLVKPEDRRKPEAIEANGGSDSATDPARGYAASLLADLAAQRTAALQESLARRPDVALVALLQVLVLRLFFDEYGESCISIVPRKVALASLSPAIEVSKAMLALEKRNAKWHERFPEVDALWAWIEALNRRDKLELLAYCTAVTLDATQRRHNGRAHKDGSERIAKALDFDMSVWWQPTREGFFERLTKAEIVEAVSEARSSEIAASLDGLKKAEMAARAEALLAGTRWVPQVFRASVNTAVTIDQ
jgi:ParB family chromosome partitioning protein